MNIENSAALPPRKKRGRYPPVPSSSLTRETPNPAASLMVRNILAWEASQGGRYMPIVESSPTQTESILSSSRSFKEVPFPEVLIPETSNKSSSSDAESSSSDAESSSSDDESSSSGDDESSSSDDEEPKRKKHKRNHPPKNSYQVAERAFEILSRKTASSCYSPDFVVLSDDPETSESGVEPKVGDQAKRKIKIYHQGPARGYVLIERLHQIVKHAKAGEMAQRLNKRKKSWNIEMTKDGNRIATIQSFAQYFFGDVSVPETERKYENIGIHISQLRSALKTSGTRHSLPTDWWKKHTKRVLVEDVLFPEDDGDPQQICDQWRQMVEHAKAGETDQRLMKQKDSWNIEISEDGNRIATIMASAKYYFGDLTVPETNRKYKNIGAMVAHLRMALKNNGRSFNKNRAWWRQHTKGVLLEDVLFPEQAKALIEQLRLIVAHAKAATMDQRLKKQTKCWKIKIAEDGNRIATIQGKVKYYFGDLRVHEEDRKYENIGNTMEQLKVALRDKGQKYKKKTAWWRKHTKRVLVEDLLFPEDDGQAKALIAQWKQIVAHAKEGELDQRLKPQTKCGYLSIAEDGNRIAMVQGKVKYFFGDLSVRETERKYENIGSTLHSSKSALKYNGKYLLQTTAWWKEHTKGVLLEDVLFPEDDGQAKALIAQWHQIVAHAKEGEMDQRLKKRKKSGKIESVDDGIEIAEDGNRIAMIQATVKYYFGDLSVRETERKYENIGATIFSLKAALRAKGGRYNQNTAWWKEHTKGVLVEDVLFPDEDGPAEALISQLRQIVTDAKAGETDQRLMEQKDSWNIEMAKDGNRIAIIQTHAKYFFGNLSVSENDRKYSNIGTTVFCLKAALRNNGEKYHKKTAWWRKHTKRVLVEDVLFPKDDGQAKALIAQLRQIVAHAKEGEMYQRLKKLKECWKIKIAEDGNRIATIQKYVLYYFGGLGVRETDRKYENIGATITWLRTALRKNGEKYNQKTAWWKEHTKDVLMENVLFPEDDGPAKALVAQLCQIVAHAKAAEMDERLMQQDMGWKIVLAKNRNRIRIATVQTSAKYYFGRLSVPEVSRKYENIGTMIFSLKTALRNNRKFFNQTPAWWKEHTQAVLIQGWYS